MERQFFHIVIKLNSSHETVYLDLFPIMQTKRTKFNITSYIKGSNINPIEMDYKILTIVLYLNTDNNVELTTFSIY
jgi:hypothetical protein